ncbi:MAG: nicotinate-nucleotide--dimethylbenzimidazole phosphoribosyltransferase [Lachnoclostridium sp.]|nr:nicotinate-nucleotide--dimethylbenzimidazole phosphoribosyltransferase [Lachnoclostridium sp.]
MLNFKISSPDKTLLPDITSKIDNLTKPQGSLGRLETLCSRICLMQQSLSPTLLDPVNILFGADHGIISEGVSVSPKEVTYQQMLHFCRGGAGINFLCDINGFRLKVIDAGVDADFPEGCGVINRKAGYGTANFLHEPAMTSEQWEYCLKAGAEIVKETFDEGCNVISFGEMGSGNTSSSSMWMHILTGIPLADCIGAGAGLDNPGIQHKVDVLSKALANYNGSEELEEKLRWFGGFELAMAVGAMLKAAELRMVIIVDGFIMTACIAAAARFYPAVLDYAIFGHQGDESGHKLLIESLGGEPVLHLGLRLGEGSGAVCAYPIIKAAVAMVNNMDSFKKVQVTKYF